MESLRKADPVGRAAPVRVTMRPRSLLGALALLSCAAPIMAPPVSPMRSASTVGGSSSSSALTVTVRPRTVALEGAAARSTLQAHARDENGPVRTATWTWTVRNTALVAAITSTRSAVTVVPVENGATYVVVTAHGKKDSALVTVTGINPLPPGIAINVGDNFQTAIDANPAGTVFIVKTGTHRFATAIPKASQQFYGETGAIMTGARDVSAGPWTVAGANWWVGGQTQQNTVVGNYVCQSGHPGCYLPEQLWVDGVLYERMTTLGAVAAGKWYFDYGADRIYIPIDPAGKLIETSVTVYAFSGTPANVVVKRLTIERYANGAQFAAVGYGSNAAGWIVDSNVVRHNHGIGIRIGGTNPRMRGNTVEYTGQLGIAMVGTGGLVDDNELRFNMTAFFGPGTAEECGASKFVSTIGLVVSNNYFHDNDCNALWTDTNNRGAVIENNLIEDNKCNGIIDEVGYGSIIRYNIIRRNGTGCPLGTTGTNPAGISIANSRDAEVHDNIVEDNVHGITGYDSDRSAPTPPTGYGTHDVVGMYVHNNTVVQTNANRAGGVADNDAVAGVDPYGVAANNRWLNNTYTLGASTRFRWTGNTNRTWVTWTTTDGRDAGSTQTGQ